MDRDKEKRMARANQFRERVGGYNSLFDIEKGNISWCGTHIWRKYTCYSYDYRGPTPRSPRYLPRELHPINIK